MRGSVLPTIVPHVAAVCAVSLGVTLLHHVVPRHFPDLTPAPFTLLGLALSIFLGFRNNACYERWWEGRKQWGQLVAEARGLVRDAVSLLPADPALRRRFTHRVIAYSHALCDQLRGRDGGRLGDWLGPAEYARVVPHASLPDAILLAQSEELGRLLRRGELSDMLYAVFSGRLQAMTTIQTACERLRSTPTPFTYTLLLHRTAWLFCLLLPFGLVGTLGLATPVVTTILAYAFFGLDALGEQLEEPFGLSQNTIPLDALVRLIEIAALDALGETDLPKPLLPVDDVLT
jgi:putative membrane protein